MSYCNKVIVQVLGKLQVWTLFLEYEITSASLNQTPATQRLNGIRLLMPSHMNAIILIRILQNNLGNGQFSK